MTLVGLENSNASRFVGSKQHLVSMMLSVQQQQHYHHARSPVSQHHHLVASTSPVAHRGNVIVTASNNSNNSSSNNNNNNESDIKNSAIQQSQGLQQQQSQAQQKRKMYAQATPYNGSTGNHQPASVARRNARERNRVKQVNNGFATLRQHIPQTLAQALGNNTAGTHGGARAGSKKLSKVETLRMAVEYIRNLQQLLDEHDSEGGSSPSSLSSCSSVGSPSPKAPQSICSSNLVSDLENNHQQADIKFEFKSESGDDDVQDIIQHHHHHLHHQPAELKFELKSESGDDDVHDLVQHHHHHHPHHHPHLTQHHHHPHHQHQGGLQQQHRQSPVYIPTPCSEASSSPTPSFVSESSSAGGSQGYGTNFGNTIYPGHHDGYESYEPMSPEDEELLDYISLWQQGQ